MNANRDDIKRWIDRAVNFSFARSGGPGGRNVDKVNTKVVAALPIDERAPLSEAQISRLRAKLRNRINSEGTLIVHARRGRTQSANRRRALEQIERLVISASTVATPRRRTVRPRRANERRLEQKRARGVKKRRRRRPDEE